MDSELDWDAVGKAYDMVSDGVVARADGDGWKVYRVGTIIRIDIKNED